MSHKYGVGEVLEFRPDTVDCQVLAQGGRVTVVSRLERPEKDRLYLGPMYTVGSVRGQVNAFEDELSRPE